MVNVAVEHNRETARVEELQRIANVCAYWRDSEAQFKARVRSHMPQREISRQEWRDLLRYRARILGE
jgi:hypothetical protein